MSNLTDQDYLRSEQYHDASNLNARIELHTRFSTNQMGLMPWIYDQIHFGYPGRLMDIGCGPADLWVDNFHRLPKGWEITLSDFSPGMIDQAMRNLKERQQQFRFVLCDVQDIPIIQETLDIVIANFMLYHVPDRPRALAEIHRVLKPGGRLYAATNGQDHLVEIRNLVHKADPTARMVAAASEFGLENGESQLVPLFTKVNRHLYNDSLVVTEERVLVDYILSYPHSNKIMEDPQEIRQLIRERIETDGAVIIRKSVGMFEATKGS